MKEDGELVQLSKAQRLAPYLTVLLVLTKDSLTSVSNPSPLLASFLTSPSMEVKPCSQPPRARHPYSTPCRVAFLFTRFQPTVLHCSFTLSHDFPELCWTVRMTRRVLPTSKMDCILENLCVVDQQMRVRHHHRSPNHPCTADGKKLRWAVNRAVGAVGLGPLFRPWTRFYHSPVSRNIAIVPLGCPPL